jgi:hypothetical protein
MLVAIPALKDRAKLVPLLRVENQLTVFCLLIAFFAIHDLLFRRSLPSGGFLTHRVGGDICCPGPHGVWAYLGFTKQS